MNLELIAKPPDDLAVNAHWIVVRDGHVLMEAGVDALPFGPAPPVEIEANVTKHFLGVIQGHGVWGIDVDEDVEAPDSHEFVHLRGLYGRIPEHQWVAAGRARRASAMSHGRHSDCRVADAGLARQEPRELSSMDPWSHL